MSMLGGYLVGGAGGAAPQQHPPLAASSQLAAQGHQHHHHNPHHNPSSLSSHLHHHQPQHHAPGLQAQQEYFLGGRPVAGTAGGHHLPTSAAIGINGQLHHPQHQQQLQSSSPPSAWRGGTSQQIATRINRPTPPMTLSRGNSAPDLPINRPPNGKYMVAGATPLGSGYDPANAGVYDSPDGLDYGYLAASLSGISLSQGNSPTTSSAGVQLDMNHTKHPPPSVLSHAMMQHQQRAPGAQPVVGFDQHSPMGAMPHSVPSIPPIPASLSSLSSGGPGVPIADAGSMPGSPGSTRGIPLEDFIATSPKRSGGISLAMMQQMAQQTSAVVQHSGSWGPGTGAKKVNGAVSSGSAVAMAAPGKRSTLDIEKEINGQNLYKTELCRSFVETGSCRYGSKCQFAHGRKELRPVLRHPKYKTEICKTFHTIGTCPYGTRCRFIHKRPDAEIGDNSVILPVPPAVQSGAAQAPAGAVTAGAEWAIWKDGLEVGGLDNLAPQQQHLLTMNGLSNSGSGISLMKAFPTNGLSSSHDRITLGHHAAATGEELLGDGNVPVHRNAVSNIERDRRRDGKKKGSGSGGSGGSGGSNGSGGKNDKRKSKSSRSRTKTSPSGRKKNHRRRRSTGADDDEHVDQDHIAVESVDYEGDMVGAAVDLSLAIEIPPIVDAGSDLEGDEDPIVVPLPIAPISPKKPVQAAGPQHRPRTSSAKERLPIFQVLCTDADEEFADGASYATASLPQRVLSPSS